MSDAVDLHSRIAADFNAKYDSSPMFKERLAVWRNAIAAAGGRHGDVLDAGCGSGVLSIIAAETARSVLAFDGSDEMIAIACQNADRAHAYVADFHVARLGDENLLAGRTFDLILCSSVLEYVDDWWSVFDWLAASLKPSGTILFSMPNGSSLYRLAESAVFRLAGKPTYYAHVKNVPRAAAVLEELRTRGFEAGQLIFYGAAPALSAVARPLGLRRFSDTLFLITCRRKATA